MKGAVQLQIIGAQLSNWTPLGSVCACMHVLFSKIKCVIITSHRWTSDTITQAKRTWKITEALPDITFPSCRYVLLFKIFSRSVPIWKATIDVIASAAGHGKRYNFFKKWFIVQPIERSCGAQLRFQPKLPLYQYIKRLMIKLKAVALGLPRLDKLILSILMNPCTCCQSSIAKHSV